MNAVGCVPTWSSAHERSCVCEVHKRQCWRTLKTQCSQPKSTHWWTRCSSPPKDRDKEKREIKRYIWPTTNSLQFLDVWETQLFQAHMRSGVHPGCIIWPLPLSMKLIWKNKKRSILFCYIFGVHFGWFWGVDLGSENYLNSILFFVSYLFDFVFVDFWLRFGVHFGIFSGSFSLISRTTNDDLYCYLQYFVATASWGGSKKVFCKRSNFRPIFSVLGSVLESKTGPKWSPEASKTWPQNGTWHLKFFTNFRPQNGP